MSQPARKRGVLAGGGASTNRDDEASTNRDGETSNDRDGEANTSGNGDGESSTGGDSSPMEIESDSSSSSDSDDNDDIAEVNIYEQSCRQFEIVGLNMYYNISY